jgi:uncharacterized membrane protein
MRRIWSTCFILSLLLLFQTPTLPLHAQTTSANSTPAEALTIFTAYPAQVIGVGESVTLGLRLRAPTAQIVQLAMQSAPDNWTATFRGGNRMVQAVYVEPASDATVDLKLDPPADAAAGVYTFVVEARGSDAVAELSITLTVQEKLPPKLSFQVELPKMLGKPSTTFRWDVTLKNEGSEDLTVNLTAEAPSSYQVTMQLNGQEITDIPLGANEAKRLSVSAQPLVDIQAGAYPFSLRAQGGEASAVLELSAEVTGQASLVVTAPDGRLSGNAYAGSETPFQIIVQNTGTAPVRAVALNASTPAGWSAEFEPSEIAEIAAGAQVEVTAKIKPADKAVAGDYMVSLTATPQGGSAKSVDYRVTVLTSTLWGVVGVALIAVAVGVVAMAVGRFGRR